MNPVVFETLVVGPLEENCYLAGDADSLDAVCVDPGDDAERVLEAIQRLGLAVRAILVTHAHADHILAAPELAAATGAPVIAPEGEQDLWRGAADLMAMFGLDVPQPGDPDRWVTAGTPLDFGPLHIDVLDTRGHSPAGLTYVMGGFAFVGDAIFAGSIGRTDLPGGDQATLIDRIRRNILSLGPDMILCPGHGPQTTVGRESALNPYVR